MIESSVVPMTKVYNKQSNITSEFKSLLLKICPNIKKTVLNFLPSILFDIIIILSLICFGLKLLLILLNLILFS